MKDNEIVKKYFGHVGLTLEHIIPRNGRLIKEGDNVKVYRNLNNDCLSIVKDGLVNGYAQYVELTDVTFEVNEKGRQRVLQERRKNVHAYVCGKILYGDMRNGDDIQAIYDLIESQGYKRVVYNPYKYDGFVVCETGKKVEKANFAIVVMDRVYIL
jgi:hypothetical protein